MRPDIYKGDPVYSADGIYLGSVSKLFARRDGLPAPGGPSSLQASFLMMIERRNGSQRWYVPTRFISEIAPEMIRLDKTAADLKAAGADQPPGFLEQGEGLNVHIFNRRLDSREQR